MPILAGFAQKVAVGKTTATVGLKVCIYSAITQLNTNMADAPLQTGKRRPVAEVNVEEHKCMCLSMVSVCGAGQHLPHQHAAATQKLHSDLLLHFCLHLERVCRERLADDIFAAMSSSECLC